MRNWLEVGSKSWPCQRGATGSLVPEIAPRAQVPALQAWPRSGRVSRLERNTQDKRGGFDGDQEGGQEGHPSILA